MREAHAQQGATGYWEKKLEFALEDARNGSVDPQDVAEAYLHFGQNGKTFEWLEKAFTERNEALLHLNEEAKWDPLRSDPRFRDLVSRVGLPR